MKGDKKIDFVKWFSELNKDSGNVAGGKGANLSEIFNLKIPVPVGFVVTAQAYDYFIEKAGIAEKIKALLKKIDYENTKQLDETTTTIRAMIMKAKMPIEMEEDIIESYEAMDAGKEDFSKGVAHDILKNASEPIFVAVRSSATTEDLAEASFAGQQDSFVNVKGNQKLITHIKKCFASLFTSRATYYRIKKGFTHEEASLAVVVQKMVDSDKSGVIFSKDPSYNNENVIMEAVWGLGEGIVSGAITPDKYVVSPKMEILDKKIADKKIAFTRDSGGNKITANLREERSKHQVLTDYEIKKLADMAIKLEEHYGKPQDVEFAIEKEEISIVQTRPITTLAKRIEKDSGKEIQGEVVLEGLAASPGIASGKIKIVKEMKDLSKINKGDILVTEMTNPDMVVTMQKSAAIVTNEGGLTAHAAIVSREMGIPCVVGTQEATTKLKEGEIITVDGFTGKIYKGKTSETVEKEVLPVEANTKTKIKVIVDLPSFAKRASKTNLKQVGLTRIEGIIAESGKHPEYFLKKNSMEDYEEIIYKGIHDIAKYFEEIWVRTSDLRSDEYSQLEGAPQDEEANPMLGMHGIRYGIKNPEVLKSELKALKRVAKEDTKIGLILPQVISVEEVQKTKEFLKEIGFNDAKVGVMVETPAAVQLIRELCDEGIDFISFGTNDLTQYMLALDRGNEAVQHLYNEMHPAILYQLEYVIRVCKRKNVETSICGQAGSRKEMVKYLVEKGIDSISTNADAAKTISDYVAELEGASIKDTDKEPRQYQSQKDETPKGVPRKISEEILTGGKEEFVKPQRTEENIQEEISLTPKNTEENNEPSTRDDSPINNEENNEPPKDEKVTEEVKEEVAAIEEEKKEYLEEEEKKEEAEEEKVAESKKDFLEEAEEPQKETEPEIENTTEDNLDNAPQAYPETNSTNLSTEDKETPSIPGVENLVPQGDTKEAQEPEETGDSEEPSTRTPEKIEEEIPSHDVPGTRTSNEEERISEEIKIIEEEKKKYLSSKDDPAGPENKEEDKEPEAEEELENSKDGEEFDNVPSHDVPGTRTSENNLEEEFDEEPSTGNDSSKDEEEFDHEPEFTTEKKESQGDDSNEPETKEDKILDIF